MSRRDSRALLLGGLVVVMAWLSTRALPASWTSLREAESVVEQRAELLARSRAQLAEVEQLERTVAEYEAMSATIHRRVLSGWDETSAQFDLSRRVRAILEGKQSSEAGITPVQDTLGVEGLRRVSVQTAIEAGMAEIVGLLSTIETDPTLGLEEVSLTAPQPEEMADGGALTAQLVVSAWFVPDSTRPAMTDGTGP